MVEGADLHATWGTQRPARLQYPLDLVILIVQHLLDDQKSASACLDIVTVLTIRACMLVNRAWFQVTRRFIYHTIALGTVQPARYQRFVKLLEEKQEIRPWIRRLVIGDGRSDARFAEQPKGMKLGLEPDQLPNLIALEFNSTRFQHLSENRCHSVRELTLREQFLAETDLNDLVRHLPRLLTLKVFQSRVHIPQPSDEELLLASPLRDLFITIGSKIEKDPVSRNLYTRFGMPSWLRATGYSRSLRTLALSMEDCWIQSLRATVLFFNSLGNTLEDLTLQLPCESDWNRRVRLVDLPLTLSHFTKLRTLSLLNEPLHSAILSLLSAPLPDLTEITMKTEYPGIGWINHTRYRPIDERLCHTDFPSLKTVNIHYDGAVDLASITRLLQDIFKQSVAKGHVVRAQLDETRNIFL